MPIAGRLAPLFLLSAVLLLAGCAGKTPTPAPLPAAGTAPDITLWSPCDTDRAETLLAEAGTNPESAFQGAACVASLLKTAEENDTISGNKKIFRSLADRGYQASHTAAATWPDNGLAHYLTGYLAGFSAQLTPLKGLDLVPVIEQEAHRAAELDPALDHFGPDRMLGNLYLSAPEPPLSIGDIGKALDHFEKAVQSAGDFPPNRLGLARAFTRDEEPADACRELAAYYKLKGTTPDDKTGAELLGNLCPGMN